MNKGRFIVAKICDLAFRPFRDGATINGVSGYEIEEHSNGKKLIITAQATDGERSFEIQVREL